MDPNAKWLNPQFSKMLSDIQRGRQSCEKLIGMFRDQKNGRRSSWRPGDVAGSDQIPVAQDQGVVMESKLPLCGVMPEHCHFAALCQFGVELGEEARSRRHSRQASAHCRVLAFALHNASSCKWIARDSACPQKVICPHARASGTTTPSQSNLEIGPLTRPFLNFLRDCFFILVAKLHVV